MMRITVVTPVFNAVKTIEQTIFSVINQSYDDIEYIIIDGGSTDGSVNIIKKYEKNIDYWISELDAGVFDAMNKGIQKATGDYIYFLGADDAFVNINIIQEIAKYLDESVDILSAPIWMVHEEYGIQQIGANNCDRSSIMAGDMIPHQGMFTKLHLMQEMPFNNRLKCCSDYEFLLKCVLKNKKIRCIDIPVAYYSDGGISSVNVQIVTEECKQIMLKCGVTENIINDYSRRRCPKKTIGAKIKNIRNYLLKKASLQKKYLLSKNWQEHHCANEKCRWCLKNRTDN